MAQYNKSIPSWAVIQDTTDSYTDHSPVYEYDYFEYNDQEQDFHFVLWQIVTPIILGIIFLLGMGGNCLVVYVILTGPTLRGPTNLFLLNLAFSDIVFLLICAPLTAYKYAAFTWQVGDVLCKVVNYSMYVSCFVTIYTLVAILVLRYITIMWNTKTKQLLTRQNITNLLILIWIVVLFVNAPVILIYRVKSVGSSYSYSYCGSLDEAVGPLFVCFFALAYVLPLFISFFLYILISRNLHKNRDVSTTNQECREDHTAFKVVYIVVLVFGISWLPHHVHSLVASYGKLPTGSWYEVSRILRLCLVYGNSCVNPFIYCCVSAEFRKAFKETMGCSRSNIQAEMAESETKLELGDTADSSEKYHVPESQTA